MWAHAGNTSSGKMHICQSLPLSFTLTHPFCLCLSLQMDKKVTNDLFKYTNNLITKCNHRSRRRHSNEHFYCLYTSGILLLSLSVYFEFFSTHFSFIFEVIKDKWAVRWKRRREDVTRHRVNGCFPCSWIKIDAQISSLPVCVL